MTAVTEKFGVWLIALCIALFLLTLAPALLEANGLHSVSWLSHPALADPKEGFGGR